MAFDARRDLTGIVASLHTPFDAQGKVDTASLLRLVDHVAGAGCTGVLATAVAGEVGSLEPEERRQLLRALGRATRNRLALVAGVSAPDLGTSTALAREAVLAGADMILWQPPAGLSAEALEDGLQQLAKAGPGPIMLQDLDWQGPGIDVGVIKRLAERVPELQAVKIETVPAGPKYSAVRAACGDRLHLSGGWAAMQMLDGLARGLDAFVPSGVLPAYVRVFRLWADGKRDAARALFERMLPILAFSNQHIGVSIAFWKGVRKAERIFSTDLCRPPIAPLDAVQKAEAALLAARAEALDLELRRT
ncbi:MAG: dihydrodipicolinate synthase family protein [Geminicoccaceae bacterium]